MTPPPKQNAGYRPGVGLRSTYDVDTIKLHLSSVSTITINMENT